MFDYIRDPAEITRRSFELIAAELDLSGLPADLRSVASRIVHASGMPEILADLRFSGGAGEAGRGALQSGAPLICDVRMVAAGVMTSRLPAENLVLIGLGAEGADDLARSSQQTRSAAGIECLAEKLGGSVVVIGNAPTALFRLLELVAAGAPRPALVLGIPVGFVGAAESKAALAANDLGLPFITLLGRRGGSAMAAAAVNALLLDLHEAEPSSSFETHSRAKLGTAPQDEALGRSFKTSLKPPYAEVPTQRASKHERPAPQPWLSIVGVGEDGYAGLTPAARSLIDSAEFLVGAGRHFSKLPEGRYGQERILWTSPLAETTERVLAMRGRRVTVLATGDPMHYGIGATISDRVAPEDVAVVPHVSSFALAAARLLWPLDRTTLISVHGRPIERIVPHVTPDARLLILAHDGRTPQGVAAMLNACGFAESRLTALAHMGGDTESRTTALAREWSGEVPDLHVLAVECVAGADAVWHPRTGLPDQAFEHDGKMTKQEGRALAIAKLRPHPGALLWDIGAGCGSVSVEWMRAADRAHAIALEPVAERRAIAERNACSLGVPGLQIRNAEAPQGLAGLPTPDAVFLGGGISEATIEAAMAALRPGGRLVAHAVTLGTEATLMAAYAAHAGALLRLAVTRAEPVGPFQGWRPAMPVTQWSWIKP